MISLYEKAAAIAIELEWLAIDIEELDKDIIIRPEKILREATAEEIDFYYERMCKN